MLEGDSIVRNLGMQLGNQIRGGVCRRSVRAIKNVSEDVDNLAQPKTACALRTRPPERAGRIAASCRLDDCDILDASVATPTRPTRISSCVRSMQTDARRVTHRQGYQRPGSHPWHICRRLNPGPCGMLVAIIVSIARSVAHIWRNRLARFLLRCEAPKSLIRANKNITAGHDHRRVG
jgi:hypothetical protein